MTHLEPIEPRVLFTGTGLDAHFGHGGAVTLPAETYGNRILATDGAVFVDSSRNVDGARFVYRYDSRGRAVTTWGDRGRVAVGLDPTNTFEAHPVPSPQQMAFDDSNGALYVAGLEVGNGSFARIKVKKFRANGTVDASFGERGIATYYERASTTVLVLGQLLVRPGGKLMIAADRSLRTSYERGPGGFGTDSVDSVVLVRFAADGTRDTAFGRSGVATVATGDSHRFGGDNGDNTSNDVPHFAAVRPYADGTFRVIDVRNRGTENVFFTGAEPTDVRATQYVESNVVSAAGKVQTAAARRMALARDAVNNVPNDHQGLYAARLVATEGRNGVVVVGGRSADTLSVLHLRPGYRSTPTALGVPDGEAVTAVSRNDDGVTFAVTAKSVTRFNNDLTIDETFGQHGRLLIDAGLTSLAVDAAGRLVAANSGKLFRFDGII